MTVIVSGQTFKVILETMLENLGSYSNHRIYYKKPNGITGNMIAAVNGTTLEATVAPGLNPVGGPAGTWRFYPYVEGTGGVIYRGKTGKIRVSEEFQR